MSTHILDTAVEAAKKAIQFDQEGLIDPSIYYYEAAARLLEQVSISEPDKAEAFEPKISDYKSRAQALRDSNKTSELIKEDESEQRKRQCYFLMQQAIASDESGDKEDAIEMYTQAIEYATQYPDLMQSDLRALVLQALDRAEILKGIKKEEKTEPNSPKTASQHNVSSTSQRPTLHRGSSAHLQVSGGDTYSDEEKMVLLTTSNINGRQYVPFMSVDLNEKFQYSIPFTDKHGHLALSKKQKEQCVG